MDDDFNLQTRVVELKTQDIKPLKWRDLFSCNESELKGDQDKEMDEYFSIFIEPKGKCPGCQENHESGVLATMGIGAGLEWGIKNGEAFCNKCSYPYRVIHRNVGPLESVTVPLPYHPNQINFKESA